jgi:hypothetical protein
MGCALPYPAAAPYNPDSCIFVPDLCRFGKKGHPMSVVVVRQDLGSIV